MELPPRARRILLYAAAGMGASGTTSACAENTHPQLPGGRDVWNYLRVRGEYHSRPESPATPRELPPRARRILIISDNTSDAVGTTSACAENTAAAGWRGCRGGNYLRVRGEYNSGTDRLFLNKELPPRARRIPVKLLIWWIMVGTTSACAENTWGDVRHLCFGWNYLRVRGEYLGGLAGNTKFLELPPRARRIQSCQVNIPIGNGTTSACAENTEWCVMHIENERNYLRVRGEYWG